MNYTINQFKELISTYEGKRKVDLLIEKSREIVMSHPYELLDLGEMSYKTAKEVDYKLGIAQSLLIIGKANRDLSNYVEAMPKFLDALNIFVELGNKKGQMKAQNFLGANYFFFGQYEQALERFLDALMLAEDIGAKGFKARILNNIGEIYRVLDKNEEALDYYCKSFKISEEMDVKYNIAGTLINIGRIYSSLDKDQSRALDYYYRSLKLSQEIRSKLFEGEVTNKIGEIYEKIGDSEKARKFYLKSIEILEESKNQYYKIDALVNIGKLSIKEKKYEEGLSYLEEGLSISEKICSNKKTCRIHLWLSNFYEDMGNTKKALYHHKTYHKIEKHIVTEKLEQKLKIMTIELKTDQIKKEAEIYRLKNVELKQKNEEIEKKAQEFKKVNDKLITITRENKELLKSTLEYDRLKTEFFSTISHELKTPLNIILSTTQLMNKTFYDCEFEDYNNKVGKYLNMLKQNSYRLLRLINNLIDITRLDVGYMKIDFRNHNIVNILEDITLSVAEYIKSKNIDLIFDTDVEEKIVACDADKIERILLNLLSNSVKFTESNGRIEVNIKDKEDSIIISVKDTGVGIPGEKINMIFERFRQVDSLLTRKREGSGIGLSLVKALVEAHGGSIVVNSQLGVGSEFIIELPARVEEEEASKELAATQESNVERIHIEFSDIYS